MSDPRTLRILSFDGGGQRGYMSLTFFQKFVQLWGINPATIAQNFDVITGTSIGGLLALSLAFGLQPTALFPFFTEKGPYIFSLGSTTGLPPILPPSPSIRPNAAQKVALILLDTPFYSSSGLFENSYGAGLLATSLMETFGNNTLQNLNTNVLIPSYQNDTNTYVLFSNLSNSSFIGQNELIYNVALATSAAPIYLPSLPLNGHMYIDGGVYENNPAEFGRTLAKIIKPTANRICVLSIGTGIGEMGFDPGNPDVVDSRVDSKILKLLKNDVNVLAFDSIATIFALFNIAATGGQEATAKALSLQAQYTLDQFYYYRFQPMLDPDVNTELDNTDPEILMYYQNTANEWFNNDIDNITTFLGHLTA